jgi:hypothetical protein
MTKKQLRWRIICITGFYATTFIVGFFLRILGTPKPTIYYETFKDLIPIILAIPAAYLGYCFQRRSNYVSALRSLWSKMVHATNKAMQYTYEMGASQEEYHEVLILLRIVIDEVRGVYKNLRESNGENGIYPYEPIKLIHYEISKLGYGVKEEHKCILARKRVYGYWKSIRENFLAEFDRADPSKIVSPYFE